MSGFFCLPGNRPNHQAAVRAPASNTTNAAPTPRAPTYPGRPGPADATPECAGADPLGTCIQALQTGHCNLVPNMSDSASSFWRHAGQRNLTEFITPFPAERTSLAGRRVNVHVRRRGLDHYRCGANLLNNESKPAGGFASDFWEPSPPLDSAFPPSPSAALPMVTSL